MTSWTLDNGRILVGERLRAGAGDEVREGSLAAAPSTKLLITLTRKHVESHLALRQSFGFDIDGIAPLELIGAADGTPYADVLVERIVGTNVEVPVDVATLARVGTALAATVARAHASGAWLGGIRPELVFVSEQGALLAPRGPRFIATTPLARGMRSYAVPYLSPEELMSGRGGFASDVFSLCATMFFLGTDRHPFGDANEISAVAARLASGEADAWPDGGPLGVLLAAGMQRDASKRPTAEQVAKQLEQL